MHVAGQYDGTNPSKSAVADASITNHACFFSANLAACRPEVNQRISKAAHIKELNSEIDKLKEELFATREKNGVYLPADHWESQQVIIFVNACRQPANLQLLSCMTNQIQRKAQHAVADVSVMYNMTWLPSCITRSCSACNLSAKVLR
jgi:hypothetical protein